MIRVDEPANLKKFAHIIDNKVVDVSLWDGASEWDPEGEVVEIVGVAGIGWDYIDGAFMDNRPVVELAGE
jgi:GH25 family lysozyme M1 (1,4-beta-N-acetylmuramidase)